MDLSEIVADLTAVRNGRIQLLPSIISVKEMTQCHDLLNDLSRARALSSPHKVSRVVPYRCGHGLHGFSIGM